MEKSPLEDESGLVDINWLKSVLGMTEVTTSERRNCRSSPIMLHTSARGQAPQLYSAGALVSRKSL